MIPQEFNSPMLPVPVVADSRLLLLGSSNPALSKKLHAFAASVATSIDLTTSIARVKVDDPGEFIAALANEFPSETHADLRVTFAPGESDAPDLVRLAIDAPTLADLVKKSAGQAKGVRPNLSVLYQPVLNLTDRSIVGFESLLRANNGGRRIATEAVLARAERGGWLRELDQHCRELALDGLGLWIGKGLLFLNMTAPGGRFDLRSIHRTIDKAVASGIEVDQIVFEAVESNRYTSISDAADQITEIRSRGVRIAIDDVGDGYSELRVIAEFEPDIIKISGNLIARLETRPTRSIVRTLIEMAHRDQSWVVAEGIESQNQLEVLRTMGCDWGQGLLLGGPSNQS